MSPVTEAIPTQLPVDLVAVGDSWSWPVQARLLPLDDSGFRLEVRPLERQGGLAPAYYIAKESS